MEEKGYDLSESHVLIKTGRRERFYEEIETAGKFVYKRTDSSDLVESVLWLISSGRKKKGKETSKEDLLPRKYYFVYTVIRKAPGKL